MYAAAEGKSNLGIPKKVGADFVEASHGVTDLPARSPHANLYAALKRHSVKTPEPESPAEDAAEPMEEVPDHAEKHAHHAKMARKAGSPAARAVHAKLAAHYKAKLNA